MLLQINAVDSPFREMAPTLADMFETGTVAAAAKGMPAAAIEALPAMRFTEHTAVDDCGERTGCSVCLGVSYLRYRRARGAGNGDTALFCFVVLRRF